MSTLGAQFIVNFGCKKEDKAKELQVMQIKRVKGLLQMYKQRDGLIGKGPHSIVYEFLVTILGVIGALDDFKVLRLLATTKDGLKNDMAAEQISEESLSIEHYAKSKLSILFVRNFLQANMLVVEPN